MKFKHDRDKENFLMLHPLVIMIFSDLNWYARLHHNIDLTVTDTISTPERDAALGRVSLSHQRGLAIDIRTKDMPMHVAKDLERYINHKKEYFKYKYLSRTGARRLAYLHGHGEEQHIHLAIHARFKDDSLGL